MILITIKGHEQNKVNINLKKILIKILGEIKLIL